ncbi:MAG: 16S rRNA (cytosine(1402)-N(4))-methyltransferase RsmH [Proteobacteria bacterium]|nr:16S rRNA (cytosine(1402)-N(4))-methyltransferase RsmH [Pseudomonadota bacterium]
MSHNQKQQHIPVLSTELIEKLAINKQGIYVDATAGYGGHAQKVWQQLSGDSNLVLLDRDPEATAYLERLFESLKAQKSRQNLPHHTIITAPFSTLPTHLEALHFIGKVNGLYADLGVSSPQLDHPGRGFSFRNDAPLDMRMNNHDHTQMTVKDFLATATEDELTGIFYRYGEEPKAKYVARAIVQARSKKLIETTVELATIVSSAIHYPKPSRIHPATRIFQALRIHINNELTELQKLLDASESILAPRGYLAVISFHSLEDRMVKRHMQSLSQQAPKSPFEPLFGDGYTEEGPPQPKGCILKPFPLKASNEDISRNPRCRSAKLRVWQKT